MKTLRKTWSTSVATMAALAAIAILAFVILGKVAARAESLPAQPPAPTNWSGLYAGVHGGIIDSSATVLNLLESSDSALAGGVTIGYDARIGRTGLVGVFADLTFPDIQASYAVLSAGSISLDRQWTIGARAGVLMGDVLIYGMLGKVQQDVANSIPGLTLSDFDGMMFGGGIEAALTESITLGAEVRQISFDENGSAFGTTVPVATDQTVGMVTLKFRPGWLSLQ